VSFPKLIKEIIFGPILFEIGQNMVLVPANMPCFGFSSCKKKYFASKNKIFCRDLFKNQNILRKKSLFLKK